MVLFLRILELAMRTLRADSGRISGLDRAKTDYLGRGYDDNRKMSGIRAFNVPLPITVTERLYIVGVE